MTASFVPPFGAGNSAQILVEGAGEHAGDAVTKSIDPAVTDMVDTLLKARICDLAPCTELYLCAGHCSYSVPLVPLGDLACLLLACLQAGGTPSGVQSHIFTQQKAGAIHNTVQVPTMDALASRSKYWQRQARINVLCARVLNVPLFGMCSAIRCPRPQAATATSIKSIADIHEWCSMHNMEEIMKARP